MGSPSGFVLGSTGPLHAKQAEPWGGPNVWQCRLPFVGSPGTQDSGPSEQRPMKPAGFPQPPSLQRMSPLLAQNAIVSGDTPIASATPAAGPWPLWNASCLPALSSAEATV